MLVAIHQPTFMPWLGYFDRMARADLFVLLDHVQFERRNYQNRALIRLEDEARLCDRLDAGAGHLRRGVRERVYRPHLAPDDRQDAHRCDEGALQVHMGPGEAGPGGAEAREGAAPEDVVR